MRTRLLSATVALAIAAAQAAGCGGGDKRASSPAPTEGDDDDSGGGDPAASDVLVPEEKFDEIKRTFERKAAMVSRCYSTASSPAPGGGADGADKGDKTSKGHITIGLTITTSGGASNVRVLQSTLGKEADACVVEHVSGWTFTDSLPKPVEHSHTYVMDRF